jgi:eight-cysteine-cluster-containing protein
MIFRALVLAVFLGVPVLSTAAPEVDSLAGTSSFYTIRRDLRRCASPMCGGYFIKLANQARTRCANGRYMAECYVASIEWNGLSEPQNNNALVRGSLSTRGNRPGKYGVLQAREVWLAGSDNQPSGIFYRVRDRGIRCIAAPCETHHEAKLNTSVSRNVAGVDLSAAGAPDNVVSDANQAMTSPDGVLAAGDHTPVTGPAGRSQMLKVTQFYLRAKPGGTSSGNDNQNKPCFKTGCSGQVCADEEVVTTCEYRPEYACYKTAKCERQANGKCGFTDTPELRRCLKRN